MQNGLGLAGKVVVITGGGSGIGRAATIQFAAAGAHVVVCDIKADWGEESIALARAEGGNGEKLAITTDVGDPASVDRAVKGVMQRWGRIDALCNNAGIMDQTEGADKASLETWERVFRVNATGVFLMTRAVLPHMIERKSGAIVNTASEAGIRGGAAGAVYTASKHAVVGLTKNVATMHRRDGIRCNAVCPGGVMTNIMLSAGGVIDPEGDKVLAESRSGMFRICEPKEIAAAMVFLASDAASNVNGVILPVDAGWSAG